MTIQFSSADTVQNISAVRAFVSGDRRPGVRLFRQDGEHLDVAFSGQALQDLLTQLNAARELAAELAPPDPQ